jgi:two-component system sensor histidine kinase TctE
VHNSITLRLFTASALLLMVGAAGTWHLANRYGQRAAERAYDMLLEGAALSIVRTVSVVGGTPRADVPVSAFEILSLAPEDRILYGVFDAGGQKLTGSDLLAGFAQPSAAPRLSYFTHRGETFRLIALTRELAEQNFHGEVVVVVGHTLIARETLTREIVSQALAIVIAAASCIFLIAMLAVRFSLAPLRRIEQELVQRDPTDLTPIDVQVPVEIRANVHAINRFMSRLANRIDAMQALIADASHQLLTPITALSAYAQNAAEQSDEAGRAVADEVRMQSEQIAHLARQLIDQAMVIHRADAAPLRPVDLRAIAMQVERAAETYFPQGAPQLWLQLPERPAMVAGDEFSLIEAVKNLVANAHRYGESPIRLVVEPREEGGSFGIFVEDRGKGIPESRWNMIGRRFDRNSAEGRASHGLGLAITNAVAKAHRARMVMERKPGVFRCGLVVPRLQEDAPQGRAGA